MALVYRDLLNRVQLQQIASGDLTTLRESVRRLDERIVAVNTETNSPAAENQQSVEPTPAR
jgi:hypothetical protein